MSVIKAQTTAAELVTAFGFSSLTQMEAYLKRHKTKGSGSKSSDAAVVEMAEQVFAVISERGSTVQPWKSGTLTTIISKGELIKENDFDPELKKRRYAMHALIGKALKHLHAEGVLDKPVVKSAAHTHYKLIEGATFGSQAETEVLGLPGPVESEEIVEAEIIDPDAENTMEGFIEASVEMGEIEPPAPPKPRTRVRRKKK